MGCVRYPRFDCDLEDSDQRAYIRTAVRGYAQGAIAQVH